MLNSKGLALVQLHKDYHSVSGNAAKAAIRKEILKEIRFNESIIDGSTSNFQSFISAQPGFSMRPDEENVEKLRQLLNENDIPFAFLGLAHNSVVLQRYIGQKKNKLHEAFKIGDTANNPDVLSYVGLVAKKVFYDYLADVADVNPWYTSAKPTDSYVSGKGWYNIDVNFIFDPKRLQYEGMCEKIIDFLKYMPTEINP